MLKKILISILVVAAASLTLLFCLAHILFLPFEHRDDHNGVGWGQFSKSLKKQIKSTAFQATDFGHYEGKVWFGELISKKKSIKLGILTRASYEDPRDLQTLKGISISQIGDKIISCTDNFGKNYRTYISTTNIGFESGKYSITDILHEYERIEKIVTNYSESTYSVDDYKVQGLPNWLHVGISRSSCCSPTVDNPVVKQVSCATIETNNKE